MPIYLDETEILSEVLGLESVLIVPCRFCPAASLAVKSNEPYIEFHHRLLQTAAYERFIKRMKDSLESRGIWTDIFESHLLHQFVLCMWTPKRRNKLHEFAKKYDAMVVLGCESALQTVRDSVKSTGCHVVKGMKSEGVMSLKPTFQLPCKIWLELESITEIPQQERQTWTESRAVAVVSS